MLHQLPPPAGPAPITDPQEAEAAIGHLSDVMDALVEVVQTETIMVRAGRLSELSRLEPVKSNLARQYVADTERLKANRPYLTQNFPGAFNVLRERHTTFHALLEVNLTVLATAHAVSEGIMRGLSEEVNRKAAPQVYGATGRQAAAGPRYAQPIAISRTL